MAVQPASKAIACAVCPAVLYRHNVSKFLTPLQAVPHKVRLHSSRRNFRCPSLTLMLQNLTHYGNLVKKFKFLKEVKFLSNFVIVNWHA